MLVLLLACANDGTVTVTCTFDYRDAGGSDTGEYPGFVATCDAWASEQRLDSTEDACEAEGIAAGADVAICTCTPDLGTCADA